MRSKVMTARPAARKGNGSRSPASGAGVAGNPSSGSHSSGNKKTVAVATRRSEPIIQMVERVRAPSARPEVTKKTGELPIPVATFVF
jgi:hypothetical protein